MNEIIQILGGYFASSRRVTRLRPNNQANPTGIIVELADGTEESHSLKVSNKDEFMSQWHQASQWLSIQWARIDSN